MIFESEGDLQSWTIRVLTAAGWIVVRAHAGYVRGRRVNRDGVADLIACANGCGRYVELEIKTHDGAVRPAQEKRRRDVMAHGGDYRVIRSHEDVYALLRAYQGGSHVRVDHVA
jgi:hypothetical protein